MSSLNSYLAKVEACLSGLPLNARQDVMEELCSHLEDRAAALRAGGLEKEASMSEAIERFGEAREIGAALRDVHGQSSWGETLAGMLPFLAFGLGMIIYEILPRDLVAGPIGFWCYLVLYIIGVIGLGIGWVKGFPRWSYPYAGLVLFIKGWWGDRDNLSGRLFVGPTSAILFWVMVGIVLLVTRSLRPLGQFFRRIWHDWTLLSFGLYSLMPLVLLNFAFDFVTGNYPLPYPIVSSLVLAGVALVYLRSSSMVQRASALLAGMTLCWAVAMVEVAIYLYEAPKLPGYWAGDIRDMLSYWGVQMVLILVPVLLDLLRRSVGFIRAG
ncbi:MAG: permease prefix domain 1-containing protein [Anaerolineae bacterium]|nr:permease prefix domain 1-containing protein [Anaerolineae bacterium]